MATTGAPNPAHLHLPYCGAPPDPTTFLSRWNIDPVLLAALLAIALGYAFVSANAALESAAARRGRGACFYGGWLIGSAALISPLCALSVSLFSARVAQHMVLETIAAPLIAIGLPPLRTPPAAHTLAAAGAFAASLWFWHAPGPYAATFDSNWTYWLMHATAFGAALLLWRTLFRVDEHHLGVSLAAALATSLQMGFLGALFTFANRPLFAAHAFTTGAWGMSPLEDQQLGGVIMWIPAGGVCLAAIIVALTTAMRRSESRLLAAARA